MQQTTVNALVAWAEREFSDREWVQKDEVLAAARNADLPPEGKRALKQLPQERWHRDEMLRLVRTIAEPQVRPKMNAPPDGVPGGGYHGESETP